MPSPPIRIAFLIERLNAAGMARDLADLCTHLDRQRFAPMVIVLHEPSLLDETLRAAQVPVHYAGCSGPPLGPHNLRVLLRLGRLLRREQVRIVHGSHYWSSIYAVLAARIAGARVVTNRIDLGFCATGPALRWAINMSNLAADAVIANCQAVRNAVLRRELWTAGKLRLIYNGCDCARAASGSASADRRLLGLPAEGPLILNVANLHPHKRQDWLLQAAPAVLARIPGAVFVCVGKDMGQGAYLRGLARQLGIERSVVFTGPRSDVPALLALAAVGTLSSETEACSNTLLEYAAAGLPVVATRVGGNPEIVADGVSGYLVPPGDSAALAARLCELLEQPGRARAMGAAGRARVESRFNLARVVAEYEELFAGLAATAA